MIRYICRAVFVVALLFSGHATVAAQSATGAITGRVVAEGTGAPLAGAIVEVLETGATALSDRNGRFVISPLRSGTYTLEVQLLGRGQLTERVEVGVSQTSQVTFTLPIAPVQLEALRVKLARTALVGELTHVPGSAHRVQLNGTSTRSVVFDDVHALLRRVPGVNISEEDGHGRRANIGMRGTGVERSAKVAVMEDGVLAAPAPYSAPAAYFFPVVGRMESIEVRKGSSQVKYGPWTTGGALNLVTSSIPAGLSGEAELSAGEDATGRVRARVGGTHGRFGWLLHTYRLQTDGFKQLDGGGDTGFELQDHMLKLRVGSAPASRLYQDLELKLGYTDEASRETYLGLTESDFAATPNLRYAASQADRLDTDHRSYQLRHFIQPLSNIDVTTTVYRNEFARDWYKLASVNGAGIAGVLSDPTSHASALGVLRGANSADNALVLRSNNRSYVSQGVQTAVGVELPLLGATHGVEAGVRYHRDEEDRFQHDDRYRMSAGRMELTAAGAPGSQDNRIGAASALAFFVQDVITFGAWSLTPGVRYEDIEFTRTDYAKGDVSRGEPTRVLTNTVSVWVPGIGVTRAVSDHGSLFGGVHRGFGPPGPGADEDARAESSVNYELGARWDAPALRAQLAAFYNDYSNILGRATLSSGDAGTGELYNGGAAIVKGLEASAEYDVALADAGALRLPVRATYTFTDASFRTAFASSFGEWGTVEVGDRLPYLPTHQFAVGVGLESMRWRADVNASHVGAMRTQAGSGPLEAAHSTEAYTVLSAAGEYTISQSARVFAGVQNLTDATYVVARRPAGLRPGLPRTVTMGVRVTLR